MRPFPFFFTGGAVRPIDLNGYYFAQFEITSGTISTTISTEALTGIAFAELTKSASGYAYVYLPECHLTATVPAGCTLALNSIARS